MFTDDGSVGNGAPVHHYAALVASNRRPQSGAAAASGGAFRGPQGGTVCPASDSTSLPSACDDGPFGRGTGGELSYRLTVPAHGTTTLWIAWPLFRAAKPALMASRRMRWVISSSSISRPSR